MSAGALSLSRIVPTPPPPTAAELKLMHLVERVQRDDLAAFEELYRLTRDDVARTLFHLVGRRNDLEDLLQETYLKLLKAVPRYKGQSRFRTFLYGVCANVALMHLRWWRRRREDFESEPPERASHRSRPRSGRAVSRSAAPGSARAGAAFGEEEDRVRLPRALRHGPGGDRRGDGHALQHRSIAASPRPHGIYAARCGD